MDVMVLTVNIIMLTTVVVMHLTAKYLGLDLGCLSCKLVSSPGLDLMPVVT